MKDNRQITDKIKEKLQVVNVDKYKTYDQNGKELFEEIRNGLLEIFPLENNIFDSRSILYSENCSFTITDKILEIIDNKIKEFEIKINEKLELLSATQNTNTIK